MWFTSDFISPYDENVHTEIHGKKKKKKTKMLFWEKSSGQMIRADVVIICVLSTLQLAFAN